MGIEGGRGGVGVQVGMHMRRGRAGGVDGVVDGGRRVRRVYVCVMFREEVIGLVVKWLDPGEGIGRGGREGEGGTTHAGEDQRPG